MIEDSLGRMVDAGNATLADLKSMLNSLMSSKVSTQPLPKTTETKTTDTAKTKEIFDLMKQLNQNIGSQFSESKKYLDQVVDLVKQSTAKTAANTDNKVMSDINNSLKKMSDTISSMPNGFDKLSSNISTAVSNSLSATQTTGMPNFKNLEGMLVSLNNAIKTINKGSGKNTGSEFSKKGMDEIQSLNKLSKADSVLRKKSADKSDKLAEAGLKKGSIYTFDEHTYQLLVEILKLTAQTTRSSAQQADLDKKLVDLTDRAAKGKGITKQSGTSAGYFGADDAKTALTTFEKIDKSVTSSVKRNLSELSGVVTEIGGQTVMDGILGPGSYYKGLTGSLIDIAKHENNIALQSKQIAFQTEGITAANYEQQKQYLVLEETAYRTGVSRNKFQEVFLQNQKKGIRNQNDLKEITTAQLFAEKQIGLEAGSLGDDFVKLKQQSGFTNIQINQVAMGLKEAARFSGLTGQELKAAYDSSKGILENMRNAATLTADSVKNITTTMAEAQKLGVDKQVGNLLDTASASSKLLLSGASGTKTLLFQAASSVGKVAELQNGVLIQTKQGQKALAEGMQNVLKRFGVSSAEEIDKLSDSAKMQLNLRLKAAYDMDIGEFKNSLKSIQEGSKGYSDRIADINKELANVSLTAEERLDLETKRSKLEKEKYQDSVGFLVKLDETTKKLGKDGKDMNTVFAEFGKDLNLEKNKELQLRINELAQERGMDITKLSAKEKTELALTDAITNINKGLEEAGKADRKIDPAKIQQALAGGPAAMRTLTAEIQKGQQELATQEAAKADPQLEIQQKMLELNDKVQTNTAKALNYLLASLGKYGIMIGLLASIAANTLGGPSSLLESAADLIPGKKTKRLKGAARARSVGKDMATRRAEMGARAAARRAGKSGGIITKASALARGAGSKVAGFGSKVLGGIAGVASTTLSGGKSLLTSGASALGKGAQLAGGLMKGLPVVGALLGGGVEFATRKAEGQSTSKALVGTAAGAAGGVGGALAGTAAGAAIGSVVPVVGTAIGGIIGGLIGGFGGGWFGGKIADVTHDKLVKPVKDEIKKGNTAQVTQDNLVKPIQDGMNQIGSSADALKEKQAALEEANRQAAKAAEESLKSTVPSITSESMMPRPSVINPEQIMESAKPPISPSRSYPALMRPNEFGIAAPSPSPSVSYPPLQRPTATPYTATPAPMVQPVPSAASPMMPAAQNMQANKAGTSAATGDPNQGFLKNLDKTSQQEISLIEQQLNVLIKIQQSLEIEKGRVAPDNTVRGNRSGGQISYNKLPTGNFNESSIREVTNL